MNPIYLPLRQYDALRWLCTLCPIGEWENSPNRRIKASIGISKSHMAKLFTLLAGAGCIETKKISNRGDRAARVLIPYDDPRVVPVQSILHTPDAVAKMAEKAKVREARAEPEVRVKRRKLIKYAGWEPNHGNRW